MGLSTTTNNHSSKSYLNIIGGKISLKVDKSTDGAIARTNKNGVEVWEKHFDTLKGKIIDIYTEDSDYGKKWIVVIQDGIDFYYLNLSFSGRVTNGLMHRLPNIDFNQDVIIKVFRIADDAGKEKDYLVTYQGGDSKNNKIATYYTKDEPNGLPPLEQIKVKGVLTWDDTKQMEFIEQMVEKTIKPKLQGSPFAPQSEQYPETISQRERIIEEQENINANNPDFTEDIQDLPF